jgi:hypothetical protein
MADVIGLIAFTMTGYDVAARQKVSIAISVKGDAGSRLRSAHAGRALRVAAQDVQPRRFRRRKLTEPVTQSSSMFPNPFTRTQ